MNLVEFLVKNKIEYSQNEDFKNHTNFKIGGKCEIMIFPKSMISLVRLLKFLSQSHIKFYILGNGTNMLCSDNFYNGAIIKLGHNLCDYKIKSNKVFAECGMNMFDFNRLLADNNFAGLEFSYGIPGSIGGAICMNAGAYNHTISECVESVKVFDGKRIRTITKEQIKFYHRSSVVFEKKYVILGGTFVFSNGNKDEIINLQKDYFQKRLDSQPYNLPCAGSVFRRLENGEKPVSKVIDELGFKGKMIGGAEVSTKHAGFIVNKGNATCKDVKKLVKCIKEKIKNSYGYNVELEIKILDNSKGITYK